METDGRPGCMHFVKLKLDSTNDADFQPSKINEEKHIARLPYLKIKRAE